jgi:hypothetical protein
LTPQKDPHAIETFIFLMDVDVSLVLGFVTLDYGIVDYLYIIVDYLYIIVDYYTSLWIIIHHYGLLYIIVDYYYSRRNGRMGTGVSSRRKKTS